MSLRAPWRRFPAAIGTPLVEHIGVPRCVGCEGAALYNQSDAVRGEKGQTGQFLQEVGLKWDL